MRKLLLLILFLSSSIYGEIGVKSIPEKCEVGKSTTISESDGCIIYFIGKLTPSGVCEDVYGRPDGLPTIECPNGNKYWKNEDGKYNREDGPAIEYANGDKAWYSDGQLHREDGPAIEYANGDKTWYKNDVLHREDGPAKEGTSFNISRKNEYWINGVFINKDEETSIIITRDMFIGIAGNVVVFKQDQKTYFCKVKNINKYRSKRKLIGKALIGNCTTTESIK